MPKKFKIRRLLPLFLLILLTGVSIYLICLLVWKYPEPLIYIYPLLGILGYGIYWLINIELRKKAIEVDIQFDRIKVRTFSGLNRSIDYFWADFDGYAVKKLDSEYQSFEFLFLYIGCKKVLAISEFYHQDYLKLKNSITTKLKPFRPAY